MKIDGKVKGGLAWAGLVVILAVPAANMVVGNPTGATANAVTADASATKPALKLPAAKPAATDPIETASITTDDPVNKLLAKGKKLPSYISDGDSASTPAPVTLKPLKPAAPVTAPSDVATVAPAETNPPVPLPRDARPKATTVASLPANEQPLILDENKVKQQENAAVEPFPLSDDEVVTGDQLEEWDSGSLADYLEQKGLLSQSSVDEGYDPDGFFLDEGPNKKKKPLPDDEFFFF
jgi:hypothetical protein